MNFVEDIPYELARAAHRGTSFVPEERAEQERRSYAGTLQHDHEALSKYATTDEKRATLEVEFARYREGFRKHYTAMLTAKSRCVSTMIAGSSNFPVRRQQRIGRVADGRTQQMLDFRQRALAAIRKALTPELAPIMLGDSDAADRIQAKIAKVEADHASMKDQNAAIRKYAKAGVDAQVAALVALGMSDGTARELLKPDFAGRIGNPTYQLAYAKKELDRLRARLAQVTANQQAETTATEGDNARLEDCPADNRVRLFFPGKPDVDVRNKLKASGFRWTPSLGCWQAYRRHHTIAVAKQIAGAA